MKKRIVLTILFSLCFFMYSEDTSYLIGLEKGWKDLNLTRQAVFINGYQGYMDIQIEDSEYQMGSDTELLLHFNQTSAPEGWKYSNTNNGNFLGADFAKFGTGSAVFNKKNNSLVYETNSSGLFAPGTQLKDFSLEFWFYPLTMEEGETIFLWKGSDPKSSGFEKQQVSCSISARKIIWTFENWFKGPKGFIPVVTLVASKELIPKTWKHHLLRFDSSTGMLEYAVNGVPDSVTYASASRSEDGTVFLPYCGTASENKLMIGSNLTGFLDEFRIQRNFIQTPVLDKKGDKYTEVRSRIIDLGRSGTRVNVLDSRFVTPGYSTIEFFYKIAENYTNILELPGSWMAFKPGIELPIGTKGRYIQLLAVLYPDGSAKSPRLSSLIIKYVSPEPPSPPTGLVATGYNGAVKLQWNKVYSPGVLGYKVYYGEKPGQYLGWDSGLGSSPIDVGNVLEIVIPGLKNGRLYYFAVVAYDSYEQDHFSAFSAETAGRPSLYGGDP